MPTRDNKRGSEWQHIVATSGVSRIIAEEIARRIYAELVCEMFMKAGIFWLSVHFILLSNPVQNVP